MKTFKETKQEAINNGKTRLTRTSRNEKFLEKAKKDKDSTLNPNRKPKPDKPDKPNKSEKQK